MQEQIRKTVIYLKALHLLCWLLPLLAGIWAEAGAPWTGLLAADTRLEYAVETALILLTIACVPLALKLFAWVMVRQIDTADFRRALRLYTRWNTVRAFLLLLPALGGFVAYGLMLSSTCLLCGLIALVAMLFCVPGTQRLQRELHIDPSDE